jgi:hypothetical protein
MAAGYSGTPLAKKLGLGDACRLLLVDAPDDHAAFFGGALPPGVQHAGRAGAEVDVAHVFATERKTLAAHLATLRDKLRPDAVVWVSWPKKAAKVPTDITEDVVRDVALPLGFVDVKVCAVSDVWSGLKLVVRKALR